MFQVVIWFSSLAQLQQKVVDVKMQTYGIDLYLAPES